eukprot:g9826.t1
MPPQRPPGPASRASPRRAHVPGPSAQVRLNDYCDSIERAERRRGAPRPRAPSGGSSNASTRPYSSSSGSTRGQGGSSSSTSSGRAAAKRAAGPKKSGKPPKAVSLEEQRRTRIKHMQRLYGLGSEAPDAPLCIGGPEPVVEDRPTPTTLRAPGELGGWRLERLMCWGEGTTCHVMSWLVFNAN